jgi:hypothetical protein
MTVTSLFWFSGDDIHLLPGLVSPRLDQLLMLDDGGRAVQASDRDSRIAVVFQPRFAGAPSNHGVSVDPDWGEVAVDVQLPPPRLRSFIIDVTVTDPPVELRTSIRIHVHEAIERMWLTPSPLTVRQHATGPVRFTVLAKFDDGEIGDVTNWTQLQPLLLGDATFVRANGSDTPELVWSSGPGPVTVDERSGLLTLTGAPGQPTTITVRRPFPEPVPSDARASADALAAGPWTEPVQVEPVQGPGFDAMGGEGVRNILFLPDGFTGTGGDKAAFERCVRVMVSRLSVRGRTRPWDLLKDTFNYFRAWVPSPQAGISVLQELDRVPEGGAIVGQEVEPALRPSPTMISWSLNHLLFEVGLPMPAYDTPGSPLGTVTSGRLADWRALYGTGITEDLVKKRYPVWLERGDRLLLNERDTAFHAAMGDRPTMTPQHGWTSVVFGPRRLHEDDFDAFLRALTDDQETPLGDRNPWARGGRDENLVVIVCRTLRHGGTNVPRGETGKVLFVTLGDEGWHQLRAEPGGDGFDLRPDTPPLLLPVDPWTAVAHELAHSFGLADEYGNEGSTRQTSLPASRAAGLAGKANVQPAGELGATAGHLVTTSPTNPKWGAWSRLAKAGVLADDAEDLSGGRGAGPFVLQLQPGHGALFGPDDVVRLRRRPLLGAGAASARLKVTSIDLDRLTAELVEAGPLDPSDFPAGETATGLGVPSSLVISPVRAPDPLPDLDVYGEDLGLVADSVRRRIDDTHNPLNASDSDPIGRPCRPLPLAGEPYKRPTEATNFPGGVAPKPPRWSPWIVGLYEGGSGFDCGAYRPTGICLMRRGSATVDPDPDDPTNPEELVIYQFCTVCRYAIVDQLDPAKHGDLDRDYAPRYPA